MCADRLVSVNCILVYLCRMISISMSVNLFIDMLRDINHVIMCLFVHISFNTLDEYVFSYA